MMKKLLKISLISLAVLVLGLLFDFKSNNVHAFTTDPKPTDEYVVDDYAHVLNDETEGMVLAKEKYYKYHTLDRPQVVMMTIPHSNGESAEDYSDKLLYNSRWHFGQKNLDNGVLILFAKDNGKNEVDISTGFGVEALLPDLECHEFLSRNKKLLKSHDKAKVNEGLQNVFLDVTKVLDKKYAHKTKKQAKELANRKLAREHHAEFIRHLLDWSIVIILILIFVPPYNGTWCCVLLWILSFVSLADIIDLLQLALMIFGNGSDSGDSDDSDDSDHGNGGMFGGGGSSI